MNGSLKWHGGKAPLAKRIVELMPPRCKNPNAPAADDPGWLHYVEPFFGGGAVLFENDPEGVSEVVNDKNHELVNFWSVLAFKDLFEQFERVSQCTPFSQAIYEAAAGSLPSWKGSPVEAEKVVQRASQFFVACRQSLAGRMKNFAPLSRNRTRRGMNEQASAWLTAIEGLREVHERLKRVVILNDDALKVIEQQDGKRTLLYLDPPYAPETREAPEVYQHEMTIEQHEELLSLLSKIQGRFILSGYRCELYDQHAEENGWVRHEFDVANHSAGGAEKRRMTECCWCNYRKDA